MKRISSILIALFAGVTFASAASPRESVLLTDIEAVRAGESVTFSFSLTAGKRVTTKKNSLVITPVLHNGNAQRELPVIVVRGKRATQADLRTVLGANQQPPFYTSNGRTVEYTATVAYENWMTGAELLLEGVDANRGRGELVELGRAAENLLVGTDPAQNNAPQIVPESVVTQPIPVGGSTGDRLSREFAFVDPIAEFEQARRGTPNGLFDYNMPLNLGKGMTSRAQDDVVRFVNDTREGGLTLRFGLGRATIDRALGDNNKVLVDLISVIREIESSADSRVVRVVIAGFASPDGVLAVNERLAWDRAQAMRDFVLNNSQISPEFVHTYNGSVDWEGLRKSVADSNMPEKYRVLQIIDETPVWDAYRNVGRHGELMRLSGGMPYRYMMQNFFPELRQAGYIKVYYENK